jgi:hypothetical protein
MASSGGAGTSGEGYFASCLYADLEEDEDDSFYMVGLADDADDPVDYIMIQRTLDPDPQDVELGLDQVYIELRDEDHSCYGGVKSVTLNPDSCVFSLTPEGVEDLGVGPVFTVRFDPANPKFELVKKYLALIYEGTELFTDKTA